MATIPLRHKNVRKSSVLGLSPFLIESRDFPFDFELFVTGPEAVEELDEWFPLREPVEACIVWRWRSDINRCDDWCADEMAVIDEFLAGLPWMLLLGDWPCPCANFLCAWTLGLNSK